MSNNSSNPYPLREIEHKATSTLMAVHGCDVCIVVGIKFGDDGGMTISHAGTSARNGLFAEAMAEDIKSRILDWDRSEESQELKRMVDEAKREMAPGPSDDPDLGTRLITPGMSVKRS
jgi:hypothetical protein